MTQPTMRSNGRLISGAAIAIVVGVLGMIYAYALTFHFLPRPGIGASRPIAAAIERSEPAPALR